jgi:hypothetical protein
VISCGALWWQEESQDIGEYAVMLAVILVLSGWHNPIDGDKRK